MAGHLQLLPAVDVQDGRAVRLAQGETGSVRVLGDPIRAALEWQSLGAEWIHLVDLDAAYQRGDNRALLAEIVGRLDIPVELSGGIADDGSLTAALATGCRRAVIATTALERRPWCARVIADHGCRLALGLDVRDRILAARGGTVGSGDGDLFDALRWLDEVGCARYVITDVDRDGMLLGPNLDLLQEVCRATDRPVVASGGITSLADLTALQQLTGDGVEGAIIGTALAEGRFGLDAALELTLPAGHGDGPR